MVFFYNKYKLIKTVNELNNGSISDRFVWLGDNLLALEKDGVAFNYIADGNKNITQLINLTTGEIANKYDYSPFGQLAKTDENVENVFKFSSEYAEKETGLIYYNYRYYNPSTGKWINRDPIQEKGGDNLYSFVKNTIINYYDLLGLWRTYLIVELWARGILNDNLIDSKKLEASGSCTEEGLLPPIKQKFTLQNYSSIPAASTIGGATLGIVGGYVGAATGALGGGTVGTVAGPVGTAGGAVAGGIKGGIAGAAAGGAVGSGIGAGVGYIIDAFRDMAKYEGEWTLQVECKCINGKLTGVKKSESVSGVLVEKDDSDYELEYHRRLDI
ncbi:RHS repeat-associated core domain-containing protein [Lentisphaerota bacterium WC36G]|nr:RHS repeat-associated core domain-containing protein [Lentisphaerae bacterium WC36]